MECQRIRVLLDLSELKDRLHKYVWMHISTSELKSIADFKDAVIKKLALDRNVKDIKMFINGGLLLEEENILVLRENDAVQIQCESKSTDQCKSLIEVQDSQISDVGLSSEICNDNLGKSVERSKKKKRKSEVVIDSPNSIQKEYLHKRKRKRDTLSNTLENPDSVNFSQEESVINFCESDKQNIKNQKKQKKSCSASTPKEDFIVNKQYNGNANKESGTTIWDITENNCDLKKKKQTPIAKDASIQNEKEIDSNLIHTESLNVVFDNKSSSKAKKGKSCSNSTSSDSFIKNQPCEDNEISIIPVEISLSDSSQENNQMEINNDQSTTVNESFVQSNNCKKKKRRRHRKRKIERNLVSPFLPEKICTLPQLVNDPPTAFEEFVGVRQHIRFTSPEPDSKQNTENLNFLTPNESGGITIIDTSENNAPVANSSSSSMNAVSSYKSFDLSSSVSPSKIDYLNELALKNPVSSRKEFEPPRKEFDLARKEFEPTRNSAVHSVKCFATIPLNAYPPLNALPSIGTCIAFKLLELNESYSPEVSSYKEGVIKSINSKTDEIEIELTVEEIKPGRSGKFENLMEGELPDVEIRDKVITCWSSLIEPRLVSRQLKHDV